MRSAKYKHFFPSIVLLSLLLSLVQNVAGAQNIYFTDFENFTKTNWQGWSADNGIWQVGTPTRGPGAPNDGMQCAGTAMTTGSYPTHTSSRFISPAITLSTVNPNQHIFVTFWQWFDWAQLGVPGTGSVQVSTKSAQGPWTTVSNAYVGQNPGWSLTSVDLSAYAGQQIWIALQQTGGDFSAAGWYVDDFSVDRVTNQSLPLTQTFEMFGATNASWSGWSADNGIWQAGQPSTKLFPGVAYQGTQCAGTIMLGSKAGSYPTHTSSRLVSPVITLPSLQSGQQIALTFWQWFQWDQLGITGTGNVEVSTWSNSGWSTWQTVSSQYSGFNPGWSLEEIDLSAYAGQQVQIAFQQNGGDFADPGWYLDNINIAVQPIPFVLLNTVIGFENSNTINWANSWYGWSADNGIWQIGTPGSKNGPGGGYGGTQCAGTILQGPNAGAYPTSSSSRLITPPIQLPKVSTGQNIVLNFAHWFSWDQLGKIGNGIVQVATWSSHGTGRWQSLSNQYSGSSNGWLQASVPLTEYNGQTIQIAFQQNGGDFTDPGWYIDNVSIVLPPPAITAISPTSGLIGTPVTIAGKFLDNATVTFHGKHATILSNTGTQITTTVPVGATTGPVVVTTPGGTSANPPTFTVLTASVSSIAFRPSALCGNVQTTGTITLTSPAPTGGLVVTLTSSNSTLFPVPATVTIPAGSTTGTFTVTAGTVTSSTSVTVNASPGNVSTTVTVNPWLKSVIVLPSVITGGGGVTGFVTLSSPAPQGGATVNLTSSDASTTVPATVPVPAGSKTAAFAITTQAVTTSKTVTLTASYGGSSGMAKLMVQPTVPGTLQIVPSTVSGGDNAIGLITLSAPASSPVTMTISSSNSAVAVPDPTAKIPAGSNTVTFNINTFAVTKQTTVTITVTVKGQPIKANLTVMP